jgi:molybdopterin-binding protein
MDHLARVSARNVLAGTVVSCDTAGLDAMVRVEAAGVTWRVHITATALHDLRLATGAAVWLAIKTQSFRRLH